MNWFAVYTKPGYEGIIAERLRTADIEILYPRLITKKYVKKRYSDVIESLFPCYIFARFDPTASLWMIKYTRGVRRVVGHNDRPWPVADEIIDYILSQERDGFISIKEDDLHEGETVKITEGPFAGLTGIFEKPSKGDERVILLLNAINYQARVQIERGSLRKV